jgi:hypothetical protein
MRFKKYILFFAGPYPSSPSSSFGHIFILLEPPKASKKSILLWDVVNFGAQVENMGSFEQFYKGIAGTLTGNFQLLTFGEKLRDYTFLESRPLWLFPVSLTISEADSFLGHLYQTQNKFYQYRFHDKNCAYMIEYLLNKSIKQENNPSFVVTPRDVIQNLSSRIQQPNYVASLEETLNSNTNDNQSAAFQLKLLEWKYQRRKQGITATEKMHLDSLRRRITAENIRYEQSIFKAYEKAFFMHPSSEIRVGSNFRHYSNTWNLTFRGGLHEFQDNHDIFPKYDFVRVFKADIEISKKAKMNYFWLYDQLSTPPSTSIMSYFSWRLAFGAERRYEIKEQPIYTGLFLGYGYSKNLLGNSLHSTVMLNINPVYNKAEGFKFHISPQVLIKSVLSESLKLSIDAGYSLKNISGIKGAPYMRNSLFFQLNQHIQIAMQFYNSNTYNSARLELATYIK